MNKKMIRVSDYLSKKNKTTKNELIAKQVQKYFNNKVIIGDSIFVQHGMLKINDIDVIIQDIYLPISKMFVDINCLLV